jgi:hypothetical protein
MKWVLMLICSGYWSLTPPVVSASLGPVSTILHGAPPPAAIPTCVEEKPATPIVRALSHPMQLLGGQKLCRVVHYWPEHLIQCILITEPIPDKAFCCQDNP